jgi:hypothetical protein|tara:strand:- start:2982 stop:4133 length:1152 start_codon:yes stop_codon:yes gene_type:complete
MAADAQLIEAARKVAQSRVGLNVGAGFAKTAEGLASDLREQVKKKATADAKKSEELNKKLQEDFEELTVLDLSKLTEAESTVVREAVNQLYEAHNDTNAQYQSMSRKEKRSEAGIQLQNKLVNISRGIDGIEKAVNQRYELKTYLAENKGGFSQDPYNLSNLEKAQDFNDPIYGGITGFATDNDGLPTGLLFGKNKEAITNFTLPYTPEIVNEFIPELNKSLNAISKGGKINETTIQIEKLRLNNLLLGDNGTAIANAFHYGLKGGPLDVQKDFNNSLDTKEGKAEFVDFYVDTYVNSFGSGENAKGSEDTSVIQKRNQRKIAQLKDKPQAPQKIGLLTFTYNAETKEFEADYQGETIIFTEDQLNEYLLLPTNETTENITTK